MKIFPSTKEKTTLSPDSNSREVLTSLGIVAWFLELILEVPRIVFIPIR